MKTKTKNKKITINDLAGMMNRGFSSVDKKFLEVNKQLAETSDDVRTLKKDMTILTLDMVTLKSDVSDIREEFRKLLTSLDKVTKQYSDYFEERKLRDVEMARMKKWIEQIAEKVGVNLEP